MKVLIFTRDGEEEREVADVSVSADAAGALVVHGYDGIETIVNARHWLRVDVLERDE